MITQAISFLAARLAAVARLRAVHCLRAEGHKQMQAFRAALERASGETYQRPSPTDSNTSTAISVPVEASSRPAGTAGSAGSPPAPPEGRRSSSQPPARTAGGSADAAASFTSQQAGAAPAPPLVPLPKPLLERQLAAAQHSQVLLGALSSFSKTGQALREYMHRAAGQVRVLV